MGLGFLGFLYIITEKVYRGFLNLKPELAGLAGFD